LLNDDNIGSRRVAELLIGAANDGGIPRTGVRDADVLVKEERRLTSAIEANTTTERERE